MSLSAKSAKKPVVKKSTVKRSAPKVKTSKESKAKSAVRQKSVVKKSAPIKKTSAAEKSFEKNNTSTVKVQKFSWLSFFWTAKEKIQYLAENYDQIKWYRSTRFWSVFIYAVLLLTGVTISVSFYGSLRSAIMILLGYLVIIFPLVYLSTKGYRGALLIVMISLLGAIINMIRFDNIWIYYAIIAVFLVLLRQVIKALRIEHYRVKNKLASKKKIIKDLLIGILLPLICAISTATGLAIKDYTKADQNRQEQEKLLVIGTVYNHTIGLVNYCKTAGYTIVNYDVQFKKKFASAVKYANNNLKSVGIEAPSVFEIEGIENISYDAWQSDRRRLIAHRIMTEQRILPNNFVWLDIYDQKLPIYDFCRMLDENAEMFLDKNSELDLLRL